MQNLFVCTGTIPAKSQYFSQEWAIPYHVDENFIERPYIYFLDNEWKSWILHAALYVGIIPIYVCELTVDQPNNHLVICLPKWMHIFPNGQVRMVFSGTRLSPLAFDTKFCFMFHGYAHVDSRCTEYITVIDEDECDIEFHYETGKPYNALRIATQIDSAIAVSPTYEDVQLDTFEFQPDGKLLCTIIPSFPNPMEYNIYLGDGTPFKVINNSGTQEVINHPGYAWGTRVIGTKVVRPEGAVLIECENLSKLLSVKNLGLKARIVYATQH